MLRNGQMLKSRAATTSDTPAIAHIYNQGIEDRVATFETNPRSAVDIEGWFGNKPPIVVVSNADNEIIAYAAASLTPTDCYAGIAEFSVYVDRNWRGKGAGAAAMEASIEACRQAGLWKLLSRIFTENKARLALMAHVGFKEIGMHEKPGKLDGAAPDGIA